MENKFYLEYENEPTTQAETDFVDEVKLKAQHLGITLFVGKRPVNDRG